MKKLFTLILAIVLSSAALQAQEAFKHLGMSLEVGTTGAGINLSYPIVTDHLVLSVGYNIPSFKIDGHYSFSSASINQKIDQVNNLIRMYNKALVLDDYRDLVIAYLEANGYPTEPIEELTTLKELKANLEAKLDYNQWKIMLEWYPTLQSNFHVTAGVFVGNTDWMSISARVDDETWAAYQRAVETNNRLPAEGVPGTPFKRVEDMEKAYTDNARFTVDGQTFALFEVDPLTKTAVIDPSTGQPIPLQQVRARMKVNKWKPYIGLGFGSSIPRKHRCGFQMEMGVYYQSRPTLVSEQEIKADPSAPSDKYLNDVVKAIKHFTWYPQISFRLTGRLF